MLIMYLDNHATTKQDVKCLREDWQNTTRV